MDSSALLGDVTGVALFVVAADRGHFNWSLPLASAVAAKAVKVEFWTNEESQSWLHDWPELTIGGSTGSFSHTKKVIEIFTALSSSGETDEEGGKALEEHFEVEIKRQGIGETLEEAFSRISPSQEIQDRFLERLRGKDVSIVIYEQVWCSWVEALAEKAKVPTLSFQPSYIDVFRHNAGVAPRTFQGSFNFGPEGMVYTLAHCLRRHAPVPLGRRAVGAMLPLRWLQNPWPKNDEEKELQEWLEGGSTPHPVVYCSLGSHMLSRVLSFGSLTSLLKGILTAECRVLLVLSTAGKESVAHEDPEFKRLIDTNSVRLATWVNQPAVLSHRSTAVFLSHCGANSIHEALACGRPIVAMPFFDDQHYNAAALVDAGCAQRIAKHPVNAEEVTLAVKAMLSTEARSVATQLQEEIWAENGTTSALELVADTLRIKGATR